MGLTDKIKIGETIPVLLEKLRISMEVLVSASKAQKIKGWDKLVETFEKNDLLWVRLLLNAKVGVL